VIGLFDSSHERKGSTVARDLNPPERTSDERTPAVPREGIDEKGEFLRRFGERLLGWARANLQKVGINDPGTAEVVVGRILVKLTMNWTYDKNKGRLTPFLWKIVWNEVQQEMRNRGRRPGDYGLAREDDNALAEIKDSFSQSMGDFDGTWHSQQRTKTHQALDGIRVRVTPMDWEVFYLLAVAKQPAPEVAGKINERFKPSSPLQPARVYRITYKVQKIFREEFERAGINIDEDRPNMTAIYDAFGISKPS
jgi:DNA-directed RNA polymerase specialized sigma24 family protein